MRTIAIAAVTCGLLVLAGCGIKGPLYIPQVPKPASKPAPQPADATQAPGGDHNKPAPQDSAQ
ncbi:MAG: lipoprotein [Proteobacteria bacterium]|nr:lipoprotein [Pseudomonadota bacterium]